MMDGFTGWLLGLLIGWGVLGPPLLIYVIYKHIEYKQRKKKEIK